MAGRGTRRFISPRNDPATTTDICRSCSWGTGNSGGGVSDDSTAKALPEICASTWPKFAAQTLINCWTAEKSVGSGEMDSVIGSFLLSLRVERDPSAVDL